MMNTSHHTMILAACLAWTLAGAGAGRANAGTHLWDLQAEARVGADGIYLDQIAQGELTAHLRLADAPAFGSPVTLTREQINQWVAKNATNITDVAWKGAGSVKVTRQSRQLLADDLAVLLVAAAHRDNPHLAGQYEFRLTQQWQPLSVPVEPLTVSLLSLPSSGIASYCILRFELRSGTEMLGTWAVPVQAKLWRDVWVAQSPLRRGETLKTASLARERRDVLATRDALEVESVEEAGLELTEAIPAGTPVLNRMVRARPVVQRGRIVDAVVREGTMLITAKVQALEDGAPGQLIRVRNITSGHEFRGKVQDEQSIQVSM
jgi:flagella basal body P-ring formation protein FlgA